MAKLEKLRKILKETFFLSSMMEITDGSFCAEKGKGCSMVQLGAYLAEPPMYGRRESVLPSDEAECTDFLARECMRARTSSDIKVCLNLATPRLEWGLEAARCFRKAGGDILELNVHGAYEPYLREGKLRAMVLPENRTELFSWIKTFSKVDIPLIVKFREGVIPDYTPILEKILSFNLLGVHFNIRDEESKEPDFDFVKNIKEKFSFFLLVSGYVRSSGEVRELFQTGADMIGFAEPLIKDPNFISRISEQLGYQ